MDCGQLLMNAVLVDANPTKRARSPVVGDGGASASLRRLCVGIGGYSPKIILGKRNWRKLNGWN